ncbi:hypothetical protein [Niveispirillum sp. KHB5.9]|uniref:hypothetical protein n=1 Tax=Niveispirillum sp. KHB5.9 TaxID=3400269 RepID=UPI003A86558B
MAMGLYLVAAQVTRLGNASDAKVKLEALATIARAMEAFTLERGPLNVAMQSELPTPDAVTTELATLSPRADAGLKDIETRLSGLDNGQELNEVYAQVKQNIITLRNQARAQMAKPKAERDAAFVKDYAANAAKMIGGLTPLLDRLETETATLSPNAGDYISTARLAMDLRSAAGNKGLAITNVVGNSATAAPVTLERLADLSARIEEL